MSVCCPLEYSAFSQCIAKIAWTVGVKITQRSEWISISTCVYMRATFGPFFHILYVFPCTYVCLCLCGTFSVDFNICVWMCVGALDKQSRPLLPPLGSLISCLNMPQWSSPKDHNRCQTLQAPSALASSQRTKMPVPGPYWVAPAGLPRSSVFSFISQLIGWGGEGWGEER